MQQKDEGVARLLKAMIPAIENIDSGCSHCIGRFLNNMHRILNDEGIALHFVVDNETGDIHLETGMIRQDE